MFKYLLKLQQWDTILIHQTVRQGDSSVVFDYFFIIYAQYSFFEEDMFSDYKKHYTYKILIYFH